MIALLIACARCGIVNAVFLAIVSLTNPLVSTDNPVTLSDTALPAPSIVVRFNSGAVAPPWTPCAYVDEDIVVTGAGFNDECGDIIPPDCKVLVVDDEDDDDDGATILDGAAVFDGTAFGIVDIGTGTAGGIGRSTFLTGGDAIIGSGGVDVAVGGKVGIGVEGGGLVE